MAYKERKTAQLAAYFLGKTGGKMSHMKLVKLLYLAERAALAKNGLPLTWDYPVSMPLGPVLSITLNRINDSSPSPMNDWNQWITPRKGHIVQLQRAKFTRENLSELSDSDIAILDDIWHQFGNMDQFQISAFTHDNCAEWKDPHRSSTPIQYASILKALGKNKEEIDSIEAHIKEQQQIDDVFASL